jgi:hypothetical protein
MKRLALVLAFLACAVAMSATGLRAQEAPAPDPEPSDPHVYVDRGMNFTAPADALLLGRRVVPLDALSENLEPMASWVLDAGKENAHTITLLMESYTNDPAQWEAQFESQEHSTGAEGLLIKNVQRISLLNGMPAWFVEITTGSGFQSRKAFAVVWADGPRGIALQIDSRLGDVTAEQAKAALKNITAVRYPINQP